MITRNEGTGSCFILIGISGFFLFLSISPIVAEKLYGSSTLLIQTFLYHLVIAEKHCCLLHQSFLLSATLPGHQKDDRLKRFLYQGRQRHQTWARSQVHLTHCMVFGSKQYEYHIKESVYCFCLYTHPNCCESTWRVPKLAA